MRRFRSFRTALFSRRRLVSGLFLLLLAGVLAHYVRFVLNTPISDGYPPHISVMIATGRGFVEPAGVDPNAVNFPDAPKLGQFLRHEIPRLAPEDIPADFKTARPSYIWVYYHKTLYYAMGLLWRVFGVSWNVMKGFRVFLFCVMALSTFGLFRLGMGRLWSLTGVAAVAPALVHYTGDIRDFSQGAFVLASMFLMGYLIKRAVKTSRFLALACVLGLIVGVGIGFRADVLACLPPALFVLAFCRRPSKPGPRWRRRFGVGGERLIAMALLTACFLAPAWPILAAYHADRLSAHDFSKGLATVYDDAAGVGRASYERVYRNNDGFVCNVVESYSARTRPSHEQSRDSNARREAFVSKILATFPADIVTRAYVSVLWVLRGSMFPGASNTAMDFCKAFMALWAAAVLLCIAQRDLRIACMLFLLLLYFCGYLSFQAARRHGFHLAFVPLWFVGVLLANATHAVRKASATTAVWRVLRCLPSTPRAAWLPPLKRMTAFAAFALLVLLPPLYLARAIQRHAIAQALQPYAQADLEPIPVEPHPLNDWVLFRRLAHDPPHSGAPNRPNQSCQGEYWAAEFASSAKPRPIYVRYACQRGASDHSQGLWVQASQPADTGATKYFFPVYETTDFAQGGWALFEGLAVPKAQAHDFKGLYRVHNETRFPLFLNLTLPADPSSFRDRQTIFGHRCPEPVDPGQEQEGEWLPQDPALQTSGVNDIAHLPEPDKAIDRFKAALQTDAGNPFLQLGLAAAFDAKGDANAALETYHQALAANPRCYLAYHYLDAYFDRHNDIDARANQWRAAVQAYPGNWLPYFHLALALEKKQDQAEALDAYRHVATLNPADAQTWNDIARLLTAQNDPNGAQEALQRLLQIDPQNPYALTDLGDVALKRSDTRGALARYRAAIALDPEQERAHAQLLELLCRTGDYPAAQEEIAACRRRGLPVSASAIETLQTGIAALPPRKR